MVPFRPVLLLVPLLLSLAMPAGSVAPGPSCEAPVAAQPALLVCRVEGGYVVHGPDGTRAFSHGPDPIPEVPLASPDLPDPGVACVPADEPHIRIVYAWPGGVSELGRAAGEALRKPLVVPAVLNANAILHHAAAAHGVEMRWRTLCDGDGLPLIDDVTLDLRASEFTFWAMADELERRGYGNADEKVLIFYDGVWTGCGGCGGWSYIPGGDSPSPSNPNNFGWWSYSAVFLGNYFPSLIGAIDEVVLHEMTHGMGGVQMSAPHSSGGWHCNDGWDIMCYADGGSTSSYGTTCHRAAHTYAGASQPYDCGNDDYFHPEPAPGSYLATHWNVGAEHNRFLQRG